MNNRDCSAIEIKINGTQLVNKKNEMHFFFDKSKNILYKFKIRSVFMYFLQQGGTEGKEVKYLGSKEEGSN